MLVMPTKCSSAPNLDLEKFSCVTLNLSRIGTLHNMPILEDKAACICDILDYVLIRVDIR